MYTDGFLVAVLVGVIALLLPALWIAWWLIADLGETANGSHIPAYYTNSDGRYRPAA
jgi:hypothetical protein